MIGLWASLSGKVCETSLMKKSLPPLLLIPIGIYASMPCVRSVVTQFKDIYSHDQCWVYSSHILKKRSCQLLDPCFVFWWKNRDVYLDLNDMSFGSIH
jgi:hypothetical protein